ncbi:MAG: septum formation protein Maf [Firmicutes bacterium]|jgi:septum formation protein|nr:septum formation protein Maf [Bacillota bacterium]
MDLVLASHSPRRRDLLRKFGLDFEVAVVEVTEETNGLPEVVAESNARLKAEAVSAVYPESLTLGADTIVVLDNEILGKPHNEDAAIEMLCSLSGREHEVTTAVALARKGQAIRLFSETTLVRFRSLSRHEIESYAATGEPLDKAGGYGIQGFGGLLVEGIKGCYYNVVGLPMPRLVEELRVFGIEVFL